MTLDPVLRNVVLVAGMPAARKSLVVEILAKECSLPKVSMSDLLYGYYAKMDTPKAAATNIALAARVRQELGPDAVARMVVHQMAERKITDAIVDGIRSQAEVLYLTAAASSGVTLAVVCPKVARLQRYTEQNPECSSPEDGLRVQDADDIRLGVAKVLASADVYIAHHGSPASVREACAPLIQAWRTGATFVARNSASSG